MVFSVPVDNDDWAFFPLLGALSGGGKGGGEAPDPGKVPPPRSPRGGRQHRPTPNKWTHPGIDCRGGAGSIPSVRVHAETTRSTPVKAYYYVLLYYVVVASTITRVVGLELLSTVLGVPTL